MANCKICGTAVKSGNVFHSACWEHEANEVAEAFCDGYCRFPRECGDEDELQEMHCDSCPLVRLLNLGL